VESRLVSSKKGLAARLNAVKDECDHTTGPRGKGGGFGWKFTPSLRATSWVFRIGMDGSW
jgi:hypothetical protein